MPIKRSYILKQTCNWKLQIYLILYDPFSRYQAVKKTFVFQKKISSNLLFKPSCFILTLLKISEVWNLAQNQPLFWVVFLKVSVAGLFKSAWRFSENQVGNLFLLFKLFSLQLWSIIGKVELKKRGRGSNRYAAPTY